MPTTRAIILSFVSFIVSAMVAGTASADWADCFSKCQISGKLVCGSAADIKAACSDIPECAALTDDQAKAANAFCDQCRDEQKACDTPSAPSTPTPPVTPTTPTTPTPPVLTGPMTPEQLCLKQGGIPVDGICMTYARVVDELIKLRKEMEHAKGGASEEVIKDLKKRLENIENANLPDKLRQYLRDQIVKPNMDWVQAKFDQVDYNMDLLRVSNAAISQRVDNDEKRITKLESSPVAKGSEEGSGWLGIEASFYGDVNTISVENGPMYSVGGELAWVPRIYSILHGYVAVGGAYSGESRDGQSLKSLRVEAGVSISIKRFFHLDAGFRTDQTLRSFDYKDSAFYGAFVTPKVCIPTRFTACLAGSIAAGSITYLEPGVHYPVTDFTAQLGGAVTFAIQP